MCSFQQKDALFICILLSVIGELVVCIYRWSNQIDNKHSHCNSNIFVDHEFINNNENCLS